MQELYCVAFGDEFNVGQNLIIVNDGTSFNKTLFHSMEVYNDKMNYFEFSGKTFDIDPGESLVESARRHDLNDWDEVKLIPLNKIPGEYYPRIYRPQFEKGGGMFEFRIRQLPFCFNNNHYNYLPLPYDSLTSSMQRFQILLEDLIEIFQTIYPTPANYNTYGDKLRNLMLLACTEVETQFLGILRANDYKEKKPDVTDFYTLKDILKLDRYSFQLPFYPEASNFTPFSDWKIPNSPLKWYKIYNQLKHERELSFSSATLENTINAVLAIPTLLIAQYGNHVPQWKETAARHLVISRVPEWDITECYIPPFKDNGWKEIKLFAK